MQALELLFKAELQAIALRGVETGERRTEQVRVYLTPLEKAKLDEICGGVGISAFLRSLIFRDRPLVRRQPVPQVHRDLYIELSRIGSNLNQQTRALHSVLQQRQNLQNLDVIDGSIVQVDWRQLESLTTLLHEIRKALLPLDAAAEAAFSGEAVVVSSTASTSANS